jgi:uncharacterized protein (DUF2235 family)
MSSQHNAAAPETSKPRQLIIGCDGTNNTLTGGGHDTNVLKLIGHLVPADEAQVLYYDPGVGSPDQLPPLGLMNEINRRRERIAGLALGKGIYENIAQAYMFLVDHFQPGDQIYIFGFSRGAFTARCVAGMANLFGIIRTESQPLILTMIRVYFSTPSEDGTHTANPWARMTAKRARHRKQMNERIAEKTNIRSPDPAPGNVLDYLSNKKSRRSTRSEVAGQVRDEFTSPHGRDAVVHFIGVWDTVSSVGIPLFKREITSSGSTRDKAGLRHIRHALSMDEHRLSFMPRLYWDEDYPEDDSFDPASSRSLRQRWFRGAHSDIGGGYDVNEAGLSDEAYRWMLKEAIACGLRTDLKPERSEHARKPYIAHDACYDTPWWGVAGLAVRTNIAYTAGGSAYRIPLKAAGAATEAHPKLYSVWSAGIKRMNGRFWFAVAAVIVFWMITSWLGYVALHGENATSFLAKIGQGAAGLDEWQRTYAWTAIASSGYPAPASGAHAFWAVVVDFALIAAYSWLLGLYASWAFMKLAGPRMPDEKIPALLLLGMAPMVAVLADLAENILTLLTLWCMSRAWWSVSIFSGGLMMAANLVKWAGLLASLVLIGCGIRVKTRKDVGMESLGAPG